jgi:OmcA/MtrC family decaheme c-type cytochrome
MKRAQKYFLLLGVVVLLAGAALLSSAPAPPYTVHDKAYYASEATLSFIRPGLIIKILGAEIAGDGTVKARVKFTDPRGVPLEREGNVTPGPVSCSFVLAYIPANDDQYVSYTTRRQTSPITGKSAVQAGADSGGVWAKVADGEYTYTLATKLPAGYDKTATHTLGAYGNRNLSEFSMPNSYDDDAYSFVPDGRAVTKVRDVIKTATCNNCHGSLAFHGGSRRTMEVCVLCHTPQTTDPDTGNTVDMPVMTHRIHRGSGLPSVVAGTPYKIIGNQQSVHDYSHIAFPADVRRCNICHAQNTGAAQAKAMYNPTRAACGSCHDNVDFATGKEHVPMVLTDDSRCADCHRPSMQQDFDTSIEGAHVIANFSKSLPGVVFDILEVANTKPGQNPIVVFTVFDKAGKPVKLSDMTRLSIHLVGPNTDYSGPPVTESALTADGNGLGVYWWTMAGRIPADAKGSWTIAIEGRREIPLVPGTPNAVTARDAGVNKQVAISVDGTKPELRRKVVDLAKCNKCHGVLTFHGGSRNTIEQCVICHNPVRTGSPNPQRSIDMGIMAHKIHRGAALERGYGIASYSYNNVGYPNDLRDCTSCHIPGTEQFPLNKGQIAVVSPFDLISPAGRETAICLSCHDGKASAAHAAVNTHPTLGEACAACHSSSGEYSVNRVHAR